MVPSGLSPVSSIEVSILLCCLLFHCLLWPHRFEGQCKIRQRGGGKELPLKHVLVYAAKETVSEHLK